MREEIIMGNSKYRHDLSNRLMLSPRCSDHPDVRPIAGDRLFSRRQLLGFGATAGASLAMQRVAGRAVTSPDSVISNCSRVGFPGGTATMVGYTDHERAYVSIYAGDAKAGDRIGLDYWNDVVPDRAHVDLGFKGPHGFCRAVIDKGLEADTWYSWQATVNGRPTGPVAKGKTLAPEGMATTLRIAGLTCQDTAPSSGHVPDDIADPSWVPDFAIHCGDDGYPHDLDTDTGTHQKWLALAMTDPGRGRINEICGIMKRRSDHDTNGDCTTAGNDPNFHDVVSLTSLQTWNAVVPVPNEDPRRPPTAEAGGTWFTLKTGNYVFFFADTRNQERTDVLRRKAGNATYIQPDDPDSTMLGQTQLDALKAAVDFAAENDRLFVLVCDPGWMGRAAVTARGQIKLSDSDKWCAYTTERDLIDRYWRDKFLVETNHESVNVVIIHGDTHAVQNGTTTFGASVISVGEMDNPAHALPCFRATYDWTFPPEDGVPHKLWTRITLADDDEGHIRLTTEPRECTGGPPYRSLVDSDSGGNRHAEAHAQVMRDFRLRASGGDARSVVGAVTMA